MGQISGQDHCACGGCLIQHGMSPLSDDGSETLPPDALRRLVVDLSQRLGALEAQVVELRDELGKTEMARATLQAENQDLRDEIARLKNLPPRPPYKPSGMEKATNREPGKPSGKRRPRAPKRDTDRVSREEVLIAEAPAGSRFKGYETCLVRELVISAELVRYRRERWLTPEAKRSSRPCRRDCSAALGPTCGGSACCFMSRGRSRRSG